MLVLQFVCLPLFISSVLIQPTAAAAVNRSQLNVNEVEDGSVLVSLSLNPLIASHCLWASCLCVFKYVTDHILLCKCGCGGWPWYTFAHTGTQTFKHTVADHCTDKETVTCFWQWWLVVVLSQFCLYLFLIFYTIILHLANSSVFHFNFQFSTEIHFEF